VCKGRARSSASLRECFLDVNRCFLFTDHHEAWAPEAARVELGIIRCGRGPWGSAVDMGIWPYGIAYG
jgi:hypothetical protein